VRAQPGAQLLASSTRTARRAAALPLHNEGSWRGSRAPLPRAQARHPYTSPHAPHDRLVLLQVNRYAGRTFERAADVDAGGELIVKGERGGAGCEGLRGGAAIVFLHACVCV
jgi:hypothetical protein